MGWDTNSVPAHPMVQKDNFTLFSDTLLMIPTLNEEQAIVELISEARERGFTNVMLVDGFSTDRTREFADQAGVPVVLQDFGKGKGCGVRTGMKKFLETNAKNLAIIDGDGSNDPAFLAPMIALVENAGVDVVLGSRTRGPREPGAMDLLTLASNLTVSFLLGAKFGRHFTDVQTGYWVFTRNAVQQIYPSIQSTGFEIELELFVRVMKEGLRVHELPVGFRLRKGMTKFSFTLRLRNLYYAFKLLSS